MLRVKSYSVLDGNLNIIPVDYDNVFGIIKTTFISSYYYLFAPLNLSTILTGSLKFKFLLVEPIIILLIIYYLFRNKSTLNKISGASRVLYFSFYFSLAYIIVESHVTSLMRRRVIIYVILVLFYFLINKIKSSEQLKQKKSKLKL